VILASVDTDVIPPLWRIVTKVGYFAGLAAVMGSAIVHVATVSPALRDESTDPTDRDVLRRRSAAIGVAVLAVVPFLNGSAREQAGGDAEPPATGTLFAAVFVLLALIVAAFFVNLELHDRIDNPAVAEEAAR
jgi:hypothetical protein